MSSDIEQLVAKVKALPPEHMRAVEHYVDEISSVPEGYDWNANAAWGASAKSFAQVWDNEEDAIYDHYPLTKDASPS